MFSAAQELLEHLYPVVIYLNHNNYARTWDMETCPGLLALMLSLWHLKLVLPN